MMGAALELRCPSCGRVAQQKVESTTVGHWHDDRLTNASGGRALYRRRFRRCSACTHRFATVEILADDFNRTLSAVARRSDLAVIEQALSDQVGDAFELFQLRRRALGYVRLLLEIFGGQESLTGSLMELTPQKCISIINAVRSSLASLPANDVRVLVDSFLLSDPESKKIGKVDAEKSHDLDQIIRKLKHPSRSRRLRQLIESL